MDLTTLYPSTIDSLARKVGELTADCALKDAFIAHQQEKLSELEELLAQATDPSG